MHSISFQQKTTGTNLTLNISCFLLLSFLPSFLPSPFFPLSPLSSQIDVLVNNAGVSQRAVAIDTHPNVDRVLLELNTLSTIALTKAVLPHMVEQKRGSIVNVSSVSGKIGVLLDYC